MQMFNLTDPLSAFGSMVGKTPEEVENTRKALQEQGISEAEFIKAQGPESLMKTSTSVADMNAKLAQLQSILSPERTQAAEQAFQRQAEVAQLGDIAGRIGAAFDPTGRAAEQVRAATQQNLATARERTLGKFEREAKSAAQQAEVAGRALEAERETMKFEDWKTTRERELKDIQDESDPKSAISQSSQAMVATMVGQYPQIAELFKRRGVDPSTLSAAQIRKQFPFLDKMVDNTKQQMKLQLDANIAEMKNKAAENALEVKREIAAAKIAQQEAQAAARLATMSQKAGSDKEMKQMRLELEQQKQLEKRNAPLLERQSALTETVNDITELEGLYNSLSDTEKRLLFSKGGRRIGDIAKFVPGIDTSKIEEIDRITAKLQVDAPKKGQGAVSNYERELFKSTVPTRDMSGEQFVKTLAKLREKASRAAEDISTRVEQPLLRSQQTPREAPTRQPKVVNFNDLR